MGAHNRSLSFISKCKLAINYKLDILIASVTLMIFFLIITFAFMIVGVQGKDIVMSVLALCFAGACGALSMWLYLFINDAAYEAQSILAGPL